MQSLPNQALLQEHLWVLAQLQVATEQADVQHKSGLIEQAASLYRFETEKYFKKMQAFGAQQQRLLLVPVVPNHTLENVKSLTFKQYMEKARSALTHTSLKTYLDRLAKQIRQEDSGEP